ncbi:MFS transporter [Agrobacterium vitis]|uniref:MFS transporter n=1 Tax=Agrobacterium vitis TaxID=373 RepID=UPI003D2DEA1D
MSVVLYLIKEGKMKLRSNVAVAALCVSQMCLIAAITSFASMVGEIGTAISSSDYPTAVAVSCYGLAFGGFIIIAPFIIAHWGPLRALQIGALCWAAVGLLCIAAPGAAMLAIVRYGQGILSAFAAPCIFLLLKTELEDDFDGFMPVWGAVSPLGALAGVVLSGVALGVEEWRIVPAALSAVMALTVAVLSTTVRRQSKDKGWGNFPWHGLIFSAAVTVLYIMLYLFASGYSRTALILAAVCAGSFLAFFRSEGRAADRRLLDTRAFASLELVFFIAWMFCSAGMLACYFFVVPVSLRKTLNIGQFFVTGYFIEFALILIAVSAFVSKWKISLSRIAPLSTALVLSLACFLAATFCVSVVGHPVPVIIGIAVSAASIAVVFCLSTAAYFHRVPSAGLASATIINNAAFELGPAIILSLLIPLGGTISRLSPLPFPGGGPTDLTGIGLFIWLLLLVFALVIPAASRSGMLRRRKR